MILSINEQARIFLYVFAAGIISGIFYDLIELLRLCVEHGKAAVCIEDVLYWIVVIVLLFLFLLDKNYADIKLFNILGFFLGMLVYKFAMSRAVMKVLVIAAKIVRFTVKIFLEIIFTPFRLIWLIIGKPVTALKCASESCLKKVLHSGRIYVKINRKRFADQMRFIRRKKE